MVWHGTFPVSANRHRMKSRAGLVLPRILAALALALVPAVLSGQSEPLQRRAGLAVTGVSLNDALLTLRQTSGVPIAFSPDKLPRDIRVNCLCRNMSVADALRRLLDGTSLTFRASGTQVLIVETPSRTAVEAGIVRGRVVDAASGTPIAGALVSVSDNGVAVSDESGMFRIGPVPAGRYRLTVRRLGFEPQTLDGPVVSAGGADVLNVALKRAPTRLPDVVIAPATFGMLDVPSPAVVTVVSRQEVEVLPQLGEDIFRAMARLPGVTSGDISTRLSVRGSLDREVSTRLDELELHDSYHLNDWEGAFGIIDLNALGGATVRAGGFGVEYGGKAGAVLDMTSSPVLGLPATNLGFSISNATALKQGSFAGDRGTWLASGRRGSLGLLMRMVGADARLSPQFYDAFAKVSYQVSPGHQVSARLLRAGDDLSVHLKDAWDGVHPINGPEEGSLTTRWTSTYGWVTWEAKSGSGKVAATTMAWTGRMDRMRDGNMLDVGRPVGTERVSAVDDRNFSFAGVRESIAVELGSRLLVTGGAEVRWGDASFAYARARAVPVITANNTRGLRTDSARVELNRFGRDLALWSALRARPLASLTVEAGLRYDQASHSADREFAPRLLASLAVGERTTIRASLGRYVATQGLNELNVADAETEYSPAEVTNMAAAGVEHRLGESTVARVDLYHRATAGSRPQFLSLQRELSAFPEAEEDRLRIDPVRGRAEGLEFSMQGRVFASWDWSAGYALARADDELREGQRCRSEARCAGGGWVPRGRDQRHTVNVQASYQPSARWHLTAAWLYHTGWPATSWTYDWAELSDKSIFWTRHFNQVYSERLTPYHRLDLRATRTWTMRAGQFDLFVDLFNVYKRANEASLAYTGRIVDGTVRMRRQVSDQGLPFLPTVGFRYRR